MAILKYLARKHDLLGNETGENFKTDMIEVYNIPYIFIIFNSRILIFSKLSWIYDGNGLTGFTKEQMNLNQNF